MRIGVISDTHSSIPMSLPNALGDCDIVLHAGDIGSSRLIDDIAEHTGVEVVAVSGNDDSTDLYHTYPGVFTDIFDGVLVVMSHIPRDLAYAMEEEDAGRYGADVLCVHGHLHIPSIEVHETQGGAMLVMCPGAITNPKEDCPRTIGKVDIEDGVIVAAWIETMLGSIVMEWSA